MKDTCLRVLFGSILGVNFMLVKGSVGNRALAVLIDSDSTHIIDEQAVDNTGYVAENPAFGHCC